ncbi:MBL fold metallo-hydrolase [Maridesulfovibrio bastinii]|uniref:MBL fold metallo-hydrolase n=1 Tax=Maridesulfovibrio bastinii TaxID=47157 RepID=UPI000413B0D5|nr:MBL fold metallo-hydrolase [Maridesulfovibrio bastinii]
MDNDFIEIQLVANAGVLVRYQGRGMLVDGIHHEDGHPFNQVPLMDLHLMKTGSPPYNNLDYLFFTHEHPDHFTVEYVMEHIKQRAAKALFLPDEAGGSPNLSSLLREAGLRGIPCTTLGLEPGESRIFTVEKWLKVTVVGTRHMGPQYQDVRNDCFMLSLGGRNILFTGDADHHPGYFENALEGLKPDTVFVNPIFYHNAEGRKIINNILKPETVVIYHLPSLENDPLNLNYTVARAVKKYSNAQQQTIVFNTEKQKLRLPVLNPLSA